MKRDMDLIRLILLSLEGDEKADEKAKEAYDGKTMAYHAQLLKEAGLIEAVVSMDSQNMPDGYLLTRMTWSGHDFLDAMKDDTIWEKAKEHVIQPVGGVAFDVLLEWLNIQMRTKLGI